jgi:YfiH family protein
MTADCLPVLFCDRAGTVVAAHAGWRGLQGRMEASIAAMGCAPGEILAWLGPAIGPAAFEVGGEVRDAFMAEQAEAATAFVPSLNEGKWLADIYQLARLRLARAGVTAIYGGEYCTFSDSERFYSYRRDGQTGRMASLCGWKNSRRGAREWPQAPLHSWRWPFGGHVLLPSRLKGQAAIARSFSLCHCY